MLVAYIACLELVKPSRYQRLILEIEHNEKRQTYVKNDGTP